MIGMAIGITIAAFRLFVSDGIFGRNWEERKIKQFMNNQDDDNIRWK
jgi:hypothetical protein